MKKLCTIEGWDVWSENDDLESMRDSGLYKESFFFCHDPMHPDIERIACFRLIPFPWNCGVVISVASALDAKIRGQGMSHRFHRIKEQVAKEFGYSAMICTIDSKNVPQLVGAQKNGWDLVKGFGNKRMGSYNLIGVKVL